MMWSLNYHQQEWLHKIMMGYAEYLKDLEAFDIINKVLKEGVYDRTQREKLNEVATIFKRWQERNKRKNKK